MALVLRTGLWGVSVGTWIRCIQAPSHPPLDFGSATEYDPRRTAACAASPHGVPCPLWRLRKREATCTGFASPGCAAPSGFLSLLAPHSSRGPAGSVSHRQHLWGFPFRGSFFPRSQCHLSVHLPSLALPAAGRVRSDPRPDLVRSRTSSWLGRTVGSGVDPRHSVARVPEVCRPSEAVTRLVLSQGSTRLRYLLVQTASPRTLPPDRGHRRMTGDHRWPSCPPWFPQPGTARWLRGSRAQPEARRTRPSPRGGLAPLWFRE